MRHQHKCLCLTLEEDFRDPTEMDDLMFVLVPISEDEDEEEEDEEDEEEEDEEEEEEEEEDEDEDHKDEDEDHKDEDEDEDEDYKDEDEDEDHRDNEEDGSDDEEGQEDEQEKKEEEREEYNEDEQDEKENEETEEDKNEYRDEDDDGIASAYSSNLDASLCTLSFPYSFCSSSSSLPVQGAVKEEEDVSTSVLSLPQKLENSSPSFTSGGNVDEATYQKDQENSGVQVLKDSPSLSKILLKEKAIELVYAMILKYQEKATIIKGEMLDIISREYEENFHVIFLEAAKCLQLIFGIDIQEQYPKSNSYVFVNSLNLTYEEDLRGDQKMPRNGFLIVILSFIFLEGNCASEERIWEFLNMMGVYDGEEHLIFGEPRNFLTNELVHQNYLAFRQVAGSHPPRYEFLWGPRTHAETTKMKILEFLAKINGRHPISFLYWYEEALREEEERSWARMGGKGDGKSI